MTPAANPETFDIDDLLCDAAINRPKAFYGRLRATDPVRWNDRWNGWVLTGYDEVRAGFRAHDRLSSDRFSGPFATGLTGSGERYAELITFMREWMFTKDRPDHARLRSLVSTAFTPRSIERLRPRVRQLVDELAGAMRSRGSVDFMSEFAFTLPVVVIAEYLGLPLESRNEIRAWSQDLGAVVFVEGGNEDRLEAGERAMRHLVDLIRPIVRARTRLPGADLISAMTQAEVDGTRFTEDEIISNLVLMVFAGHETTMNLLGNSVVAFDESPGEWARLTQEPDLARTAVEETLRYDGPIRALARWATEPLEIGGLSVSRGDRVLLVQYAANHDPAAFPSPELFDIGRRPNKHLSFGHGIHACIGAALTRLEAEETLRYLAQNFSRIAVTEPELTYNRTLVSRGLQTLHVRFEER